MKIFLKHFVTTQLFTVAVQVLSLVSSISIHRTLTVDDRGLYASLVSVASLAAGILSLGLDVQIARKKHISGPRASFIFLLHSILIVFLSTFPAFLLVSFAFHKYIIFLTLTSILITASGAINALYLSWLVIRAEIQQYNTVRTTHAVMFALTCGFGYLIGINSLLYFLLCYLLSSFSANMFAFTSLTGKRFSRSRTIVFYSSQIYPLKSRSLLGGAHTLLYGMITFIPTLLSTPKTVGLLAATSSIVTIAQGVSANISKSLVSYAKSAETRDQRQARNLIALYVLGLIFVFSAFFFVLPTLAVMLFGVAYTQLGSDAGLVAAFGFLICTSSVIEDVIRATASMNSLVWPKVACVTTALLMSSLTDRSYHWILMSVCISLSLYVIIVCAVYFMSSRRQHESPQK